MKSTRILKSKIIIGSATALTVLIGSSAAAFGASNEIHVSVDGNQKTIRTFESNVGNILDREGLTKDQSTHEISPSIHATVDSGDTISVDKKAKVIVSIDGNKSSFYAQHGETYRDALLKRGIKLDRNMRADIDLSKKISNKADNSVKLETGRVITIKGSEGDREIVDYDSKTVHDLISKHIPDLSKEDRVYPSPENAVKDGMSVRIDRMNSDKTHEDKVIPFITRKVKDKNLPEGEEKVVQEGKDGKLTIVYSITKVNGKESSRKAVEQKVSVKPIDKVIAVGTKKPAPPTPVKVDSNSGSVSQKPQPGKQPSENRVEERKTNDTPQDGSPIGGTNTCGASFYGGGDGTDGGPTASGETFDASKLTAAHKTLPLGTKVRVTNPDTGQSVVVRINDRGPYISGRCLDLSVAAFDAIGNLDRGHMPVNWQIVE